MTADMDCNRTSHNSADGESARSRFGPLTSPLVCVLLFCLVLVTFLPCVRNGFIYLDDGHYVTSNPQMRQGLSWAGLGWAFRTTQECNWHPLTWLSHMADCQIFGLHPWGHHLTSVLLH